MANTRDFNSLGIWAEAAETTIPPSPLTGTSYRDLTVTDTANKLGDAYNTKPDSAVFNQKMWTITSFIDMLDKTGGIGWSNMVDYAKPALVWGSDTNFYIALQASGPSTVAKDPISEPTYWELVTSAAQLRQDLESQTPGDEGSRRVGYNKFDINGGIDDGLTVKEALDELVSSTNDLHGLKLYMSGSFDGTTGLSTSSTFNIYQNKAFIEPDVLNPALIYFTVFADSEGFLPSQPLVYVTTNSSQDPDLPPGNFTPTVNSVIFSGFSVPPAHTEFKQGVRVWQYLTQTGLAETTQQDFNVIILTL